MKCQTHEEQYDLIYALALASKNGDYSKHNLYDSFAPRRKETFCKILIDGEDYFKEVYHKIDEAKGTIYITDWWLYPPLQLIRPAPSKEGNSKQEEDKQEKDKLLADFTDPTNQY